MGLQQPASLTNTIANVKYIPNLFNYLNLNPPVAMLSLDHKLFACG